MTSWAPVGAVVSVGPYDWNEPGEPPPGVGDWLVTSRGTAYLILEARIRPSGRHYYRCLKGTVEDIPEGARVCSLAWYSRDGRTGGGRCKRTV